MELPMLYASFILRLGLYHLHLQIRTVFENVQQYIASSGNKNEFIDNVRIRKTFV